MIGLLLVGAFGSAGAAAAEDDVPSGVRAWFRAEGTALASAIEGADGIAHPGPVRRTFHFSDAFVAGRPGAALVAGPEWVAGAAVGDRAVGVVVARLAPGAVVPTGGVDADPVLAAALLDPAGAVVEDPRSAGWFRLRGTWITAINAWARTLLPAPADLRVFQRVLAARVAADRAASAGLVAPVGGGGLAQGEDLRPPAAAGAAAAAAALAATAVLRRRRVARSR